MPFPLGHFDYKNFDFKITFQSEKNHARLGTLSTPHGSLETPAFIFCATKAAIKGATPKQLRDADTQIILSNTYHLMVHPGAKTVKALGGLQKMTGWNGPMLTDSGGFQIFSLGHGSVAEEIKGNRDTKRPKTMLKITEQGAQFKSYMDGKVEMLTPERSIQVQRDLGADFILTFDECTPFNVAKSYTQKSMERSHRWGDRSLQEFERGYDGSQALYGIIQGGVYEDLRQDSIDWVNSRPFFGHAIGGSLGQTKEQMYEIVNFTAPKLEKSRPIHLLGIGGVRDIFNGVKAGIDTFDCVHPTRLARHGGALIQPHLWEGPGDKPKDHINLKNKRFTEDTRPIDETCECETCQTFSRGYIQHLMKAKEILAQQALTIHNIFFMNRLLKAVRQAIKDDRLDEEEKLWVVPS